MSKWEKYGMWRHPKEWWQIQLIQYIKKKHPDKIQYNPQIIEVRETEILFGMNKHYGHLQISKTEILKTITHAKKDI